MELRNTIIETQNTKLIIVCLPFNLMIFEESFIIFVDYSYNPCYSFSKGSLCQNVAVCQG